MLLSETDAKTKECRAVPFVPIIPQVYFPRERGPGYGDSVPGVERPHCIGSGCMHWRWGEPTYEDHTSDQQHKPNGDGWKWTHVATGDSLMGQHRWRRISERRGYCGLAGRP